MRQRVFIFIVLVLTISGIAFASEIEVTASVNRQTAYIGDLIEYTVTITYDSTLELIPPAVGLNLGQFDVKDYDVPEEKQLDNGKLQQVLWFEMRTFTTGEYVIPPLPIEYVLADSTMKIISTDPIKINIKSIIAEGESTDSLTVRDMKQQASLKSGLPLWAMLLLIGVGIAIVSVSVWWWFKKRGEEEAAFIDPRPSWEIAFADLAMLKQKNLPAEGELKLYYLELTEIIRRYLGKKFEFDAIDLTTTEIDEYFESIEFDRDFQKELTTFLNHADLVKFAKFVPLQEQPDIDWQKSYELIDQSKDMEVITPEPENPDMYIPQSYESYEGDEEWKYAPPGYKDMVSAKSDGVSIETSSDEEDA